MKNKIRSKIVNFLSSTVGAFLVYIAPSKAKELASKGMTLVMDKDLTILEKLMRRAILRKLEKNGNFDTLADFHQNFWVEKGDNFFTANDSQLENVFIPSCDFIFDLLKNQLTKETEKFTTIVEIGTGNGTVLNHLSHKFSQMDKLIGIDLNKTQTLKNKEKYKNNPRLEFVAGDGFDWLEKNGKSHTIFLTFMGVLEYFTENRLQAFFEAANNLGKIIFIAIEPNDSNHDLELNPRSKVYGPESSFSHNYPNLLKKAGFNLWHYSKKTFEGDTNYIVFVGAKNWT
ncbi:methyltransferase domain-containing protein [Flagellimonas sp. HMM57]|uniref:class I SAM-dependent methyltransferase n=1 Tax=unclassified Flagellimonas TaxID=2644544 RepID=UPI0013D51ADE|nr:MULTISPECIES: class I SAM-dependent methyltransferase [unclassified Flagellimonas]UII76106.1 methyltransferase domain-containing protein [Flagellimonas sp. HMM57]